MTVPFTLLNAPRTVEIARCFTENCAAVCAGSSCQVVVAAVAGNDKSAARPVASAKRVRDWTMVFSPLIFRSLSEIRQLSKLSGSRTGLRSRGRIFLQDLIEQFD